MTRKEKLDKVIHHFFTSNPKIHTGGLNSYHPNNISSVCLFLDGVSRLIEFDKTLGITKGGYRGSSLRTSANLFEKIKPSWLSELLKNHELHEYVNKTFQVELRLNRNYNSLFIYLFIYWEVYKDTQELQAFKHLEHPYASLVKIAINADCIRAAKGGLLNLSLLDSSIDLNIKLKLPSIEDDFLTYIDKSKYNKNYDGVIHYTPNQEEIDELYQEFLKNK